MLERDDAKQLCGRIEIDDAYIGGERPGGKRGRGAAGKTPFVAAVETTPEGKPVPLKLRRVAGFRSASNAAFAKQSFDPACAVVSDGLACFAAVTGAGCNHAIVKTGSGPSSAKAPVFKWVNTALGNIPQPAPMMSSYGLERTKLNHAIGLDSSPAELDPQNPNPRGYREGEPERDPLDEIIRTFNERWFQGWSATPEEQRVKFINIVNSDTTPTRTTARSTKRSRPLQSRAGAREDASGCDA